MIEEKPSGPAIAAFCLLVGGFITGTVGIVLELDHVMQVGFLLLGLGIGMAVLSLRELFG